MGLLQIVNLLSSLLPALIGAIKMVESAMPETGSGKKKLDMVTDVMRDAYAVADATKDGVNFAKLVPVVATVTGHLVSHFNATDAWNKVVVVQTPAQSTAPEAP